MPSLEEETWSAALAQMKGQVTRSTYDTLLVGTALLSISDGYVIEAASEYSADLLEHRQAPMIARVLSRILNETISPDQLRFVARPDQETAADNPAEDDVVDEREEEPYFRTYRALYRKGYAARLGPHATAIYQALCCHLNTNRNERRAWPFINTLVEETGVGRTKTKESLKLLEQYNLIRIEKRYGRKGAQTSNRYHVLDVSAWKLLDD